jgi:uncharacterized protein YqeY
MSLEATLQNDLKTAMLAKDERTVAVLRMVKSTLLYAKVAAGSRDEEMADEAVQELLAKEAKKRQESADLYVRGGNAEKAEAELAEKAIIERYLPEQLGDDEIRAMIDTVITEMGTADMSKMGQVIGAVKAKAGTSADGAVVARLVKERLSS